MENTMCIGTFTELSSQECMIIDAGGFWGGVVIIGLTIIGAAGGAALGVLAGAGAGSFTIPVIGSVTGAVLGGVGGAIGGAIAGASLGVAIADYCGI